MVESADGVLRARFSRPWPSQGRVARRGLDGPDRGLVDAVSRFQSRLGRVSDAPRRINSPMRSIAPRYHRATRRHWPRVIPAVSLGDLRCGSGPSPAGIARGTAGELDHTHGTTLAAHTTVVAVLSALARNARSDCRERTGGRRRSVLNERHARQEGAPGRPEPHDLAVGGRVVGRGRWIGCARVPADASSRREKGLA